MARPYRTDLTAELVRSLFDYGAHSGQLWWRVGNAHRVRAGDSAGCVDTKGYRVVGIGGRNYKAHRIIWLMMTGAFPKHQIDHADGDPSNNRWENLREATRIQNSQNCGRRRNNSSGYTGVVLERGGGRKTPRWRAYIKVNGTPLHLGFFGSPEAAYAARLAAEVSHFGEFRRTP
jgi:hypothetical protein